jgi:acetyltransferase
MSAQFMDMTDGRSMCLRPLKQSDEPLIEAGITALSDKSRYFRFFSQFKKAPPSVLDRLTNFSDDHIAWGAVDNSLSDQPPIAAAHLIHLDTMADGTGEFAIAVLDAYQNLGVARTLTYCLFKDALENGYEQAVLDVLAENQAGLSLFKWMGGKVTGQSSNVLHLKITLAEAISQLEQSLIKTA